MLICSHICRSQICRMGSLDGGGCLHIGSRYFDSLSFRVETLVALTKFMNLGVLQLRIYALYQGNKTVTRLMITLFFLFMSSASVILGFVLSNAEGVCHKYGIHCCANYNFPGNSYRLAKWFILHCRRPNCSIFPSILGVDTRIRDLLVYVSGPSGGTAKGLVWPPIIIRLRKAAGGYSVS